MRILTSGNLMRRRRRDVSGVRASLRRLCRFVDGDRRGEIDRARLERGRRLELSHLATRRRCGRCSERHRHLLKRTAALWSRVAADRRCSARHRSPQPSGGNGSRAAVLHLSVIDARARMRQVLRRAVIRSGSGRCSVLHSAVIHAGVRLRAMLHPAVIGRRSVLHLAVIHAVGRSRAVLHVPVFRTAS